MIFKLFFTSTLTFDQHGFELHKSTYMQFFFSINTCTIFDLRLGVSETEYALTCAILYRGLEHYGFWYSQGGPEIILLQIMRDNLSFGGSKVKFLNALGGVVIAPSPHICV